MEASYSQVSSQTSVLLIRSGGRTAALPLAHVIEILRPLPLARFPHLPEFVLGLASIRGASTPVVDLGALLGAPVESCGRWVLLRLGERRVGLAVERVLGLRDLDATSLGPLPPLLDAVAGSVEALGSLDAELLLLLKATGIVPPQLWETLASREATA